MQLPGVQDTARAKDILGATATLEFRMVHEGDVAAAVAGRVPVGAKLFREREGRPILLRRQVMLTGEYITDAYEVKLAADAPPGEYQLVIGLYNPETGERLPVNGPDCQPDACFVPGLTVK